MTRPWF